MLGKDKSNNYGAVSVPILGDSDGTGPVRPICEPLNSCLPSLGLHGLMQISSHPLESRRQDCCSRHSRRSDPRWVQMEGLVGCCLWLLHHVVLHILNQYVSRARPQQRLTQSSPLTERRHPDVVSPALSFVYPHNVDCNTASRQPFIINMATLTGTIVGMIVFGCLADLKGNFYQNPSSIHSHSPSATP